MRRTIHANGNNAICSNLYDNANNAELKDKKLKKKKAKKSFLMKTTNKLLEKAPRFLTAYARAGSDEAYIFGSTSNSTQQIMARGTSSRRTKNKRFEGLTKRAIYKQVFMARYAAAICESYTEKISLAKWGLEAVWLSAKSKNLVIYQFRLVLTL